MTGDEMERAIEFLLQSQANSEARIGRLETAQEQTNQQIRDLAASQQRTQGQLDELRGVVQQNAQQLSYLSNVVASLAESQQQDRGNINVLVKLVGGLIEGRNGNGAEDDR